MVRLADFQVPPKSSSEDHAEHKKIILFRELGHLGEGLLYIRRKELCKEVCRLKVNLFRIKTRS